MKNKLVEEGGGRKEPAVHNIDGQHFIEDERVAQELTDMNESACKTAEEYQAETERFLSKVTEYVTGIPYHKTEKLIARMVEDHQIIKAKYGLPPRDLLYSDPAEYRRRLMKVAKNNSISVRAEYELEEWFEESGAEGTYSTDSRDVFIDLKRPESEYEVYKQINNLEHEIIHALQFMRYPRMPIEKKEYEAFLSSNINIKKLEQNPSEILLYFWRRVLKSVNMFYKQEEGKARWTLES
ncbi:hypothetical protein GF362_06465 [Candidatus Dojkabacteria bacterium]|nr:hypothetical protein [Candidatus Dojkabacteria bacterium]